MVATMVASCGVPPDEGPRPIDPPRSPFPAPEATSPDNAGGAIPHTLFLVQDGKLVAVTRRGDTALTPDDLVAALVAGPTDRERDQGLTSALLGSTVVVDVRLAAGRATIELATAVDGAPRPDDLVVYAQLVCTLTARPGITGVSFTRDGTLVGVPRADGSLSRGPLTTEDYAALIAPLVATTPT